MALSITLTPDVTTYLQGDAPISVSMGAGASNYTYALWESDSGTFLNKYADTTTFTPNNATKSTKIIGRRVNRVASSNSSNLSSADAGLTFGKTTAGADYAWDTFMWFANPIDGLNAASTGFLQAVAVDLNEKTMGFGNTTQLNPETVGTMTTSIAYCWHLQSTGLATPRHLGALIASPVTYKVGSVFKIELTTAAVNYYVDGIWIASAPRLLMTSYYAMYTFYERYSWWTMASYLNDLTYTNAEGSRILGVTGLFPVQPNYSYNASSDVTIITSAALDGSEKRRKKSKVRTMLNLQFVERPDWEYRLIADFWSAHEKHQRFVYQDIVLGESYIMRFEAPLSVNMRSANTIDIQATLREV